VNFFIDVVVVDDFARYDILSPILPWNAYFKGARHGKGTSLYMKISSTKEISKSLL
jgi:hypothetical protein